MRLGLMIFMGMLVAACAAVQPAVQQDVPVGLSVQSEQSVIRPAPDVEQGATLLLAATGDIMLGGSAEPWLQKNGYTYAFAGTRALYADADILIGNLETALTDAGGDSVEKKYRFRNPPDKVASALKDVGFDIVTLANNHSMDYGEEGLRDTMAVLSANGIQYHGAGMNAREARRSVVIDVPGKAKVGFLAYTKTFPEEFWAGQSKPGTAFGHESHVRQDVKRLKAESDLVVVSFHWGRESTTELRPYQIVLAHAAIDAGADVVLGHHPHVLQAVERYRHGVILYSLGNYTFGSFSNRVSDSVIARLYFDGKHFSRLEMVPINVNNFQIYFQPVVFSGEAADKVFKQLESLSLQRQTQLQYDNGTIKLLPRIIED